MATELVIVLICSLLPIAAASGWIAARKKAKTERLSTVESIAPGYYKGLRYVINEQPDKAIEVFLKLLEVDSDTVEVHLALGNLFRRRGEVTRAIRIHENLIARPTLSNEQRSQAVLELGVDYLSLGLLDRAEDLFLGLLESAYKGRAARYLVKIYEDEKEWRKAIEFATIWQRHSSKDLSKRIAHYHCYKAEELFESEDPKVVSDLIKQALKIDPNSVHASIIEGKLKMRLENYKAASKSFKRIEKQSPEYLNEVLNPLKVCYRELGKSGEFLDYLRKLPTTQAGVNQVVEMSDLIEEHEGTDNAVRFLVGKIDDQPSVRMLDRLIDLSLSSETESDKTKIECFKRLTGKLIEMKNSYQCNNCGYQARSIYWQCPACKNWDSVKPTQGKIKEQ